MPTLRGCQATMYEGLTRLLATLQSPAANNQSGRSGSVEDDVVADRMTLARKERLCENGIDRVGLPAYWRHRW